MSEYDWSRFAVRININASIEKLYWCWATREGMEFWFLRVCEYKNREANFRADDEYLQKADTYRWLWHGWPDEVVELGEILACNGVDHLKFKFGNAGNCTVKIYTEENEKIVELVQDNIPTDEKAKTSWHLGCKTGWTFYLANLKSLLEGGIDLRNKNEKIQRVINS